MDANGTYVPGDHVPLRGAATHGICPDCKDALVREEAEAPAPLPVG